ncbi:MAG TPA: thioesterase family protein [Actinocrinis sp.]|nr:thioesterase family protein [Actinocrinis sp.]
MSALRRPDAAGETRAGQIAWTRLPDAIVDGERLGLHVAGEPDRPALLLLHGIEDGWSSWNRLVPWLLPDYRCYAVDLPWRTAGDYRWRSRGAAWWTGAALAALPQRPAVVVAHSFSANALLQGIDAGTPLAADAMVLISPFYRPPTVPVDWHTFECSRADFYTTMTAGLRIRLGDRVQRLEPEIFDRMARTMLDGIGVLGFLAVFEQFAAASELDLSADPARSMVVAGALDPGIAGERADWLARALPGAEMHVHRDFSHFCHVEQPDRVGPLIVDFLRGRRDRGAAPAGSSTSAAAADPRPTPVSPPERNLPMPTPDETPGRYTGRPRYEGANISTFIGFKNFTALAEDALLQHFRDRGFGPQGLFERYGLGLTVVHSSLRLTATMHTDDLVVADVTAIAAKPGQGAAFDVKLAAERDGQEIKLLNGKMRVQLVAEKDGTPVEPVPAELAAYVVPEVATAGAASPVPAADAAQVTAALAAASGNDFAWSYKIPYFACHYYTRIQHSAYAKLLEEAVDRYLEHVDLPITGLLAQRDWIPVVSRSRIDLHADAHMGETLLITFAVDDVIKDTVFTARMECRVQRADQLVHIASATIMHGYVLARGERAFQDLVVLDAPTQTALLGGAA